MAETSRDRDAAIWDNRHAPILQAQSKWPVFTREIIEYIHRTAERCCIEYIKSPIKMQAKMPFGSVSV